MDIQTLAETQPDVAEQVLERDIDTQSDDIFTLRVLGEVKFALGKYDEALVYLNRALRINYRDGDANRAIALVYRELNNYHAATMYMFRVLDSQSNQPRNWVLQARLFSEIKAYVAAKHYYGKTLQIDPSYLPAHYGLLSVYAKEKNWDRFIEEYEWIVSNTSTSRIGIQFVRYCPKPLMGLFSYLIRDTKKTGDSPMAEVTGEPPPAGVTVTV